MLLVDSVGLINPTRVDAILSTETGVMVIIDGQAHIAKNYYNVKAEPIKATWENWICQIVSDFAEWAFRKKLKAAQSNVSKLNYDNYVSANKIKALEKEIAELKQAKEEVA